MRPNNRHASWYEISGLWCGFCRCTELTALGTTGIVVLNLPLHESDAFSSEVAVVRVSLADFLYMYSGEASAAEIAGMCMSGRVSVPWSSYGKLKAFAECFDFSSEKWEEYYAAQAAKGIWTVMPQCSKPCCQSTTKEEIDANWLLVADATSSSSIGNDWEVVSDCMCYTVAKETVVVREQREEIFGLPQLDGWITKICHAKATQQLQSGVKSSFSDLKDLAGRLFVPEDPW